VKRADREKLEAEVRRKYMMLRDSMDERVARHWAASEAIAIGHSGVAIVARATGMAPRRIGLGKRELLGAASDVPVVEVRRRGGGRRLHEEVHPNARRACGLEVVVHRHEQRAHLPIVQLREAA
jgi:hypothetical protein